MIAPAINLEGVDDRSRDQNVTSQGSRPPPILGIEQKPTRLFCETPTQSVLVSSNLNTKTRRLPQTRSRVI